MRSATAPAEQRLWFAQRAHRFRGVKFARQVVIGGYIVDFAARSARLAVEPDGDSHGGHAGYDTNRTVDLQARGYRVIRFSNTGVMRNLEGVPQVIGVALGPAPLPTLSPEGRGFMRS